jgi:copper(I)-binding protein
MIRLLVRAAVLAALAAPLAQAQTPPAGGVTVEHPWARATAASATSGAAYLTLHAHGAADRLTGASTPAAGTAELHESSMVAGIMHMRPLPEGITLPADKAVTLVPGGLHLMLLQLTHPLKQGETFPLTLTFAHAAPVTLQVPVQAAGASDAGTHPAGDGHPGMHMGNMKP